ncbi:hypothetical protein FSP39_015018 [Pinctada imbricata]|uniref:Mab-21-like nucleotidyltransferase domain-containing protein n=1 Tax=Pinctada imbricata TaxID=66713 RepID=A0AA89BZF7_PINIB|nr:hypothetical protein FSP39_015018 [Pinctada imbricata]
MIQDLASAIGNLDQRFKCVCIPSGSFYDELKIDKPDEFDFVLEIEALSTAGVCMVVPSRNKLGFTYLAIVDETEALRFSEFLFSPEDEGLEEECEHQLLSVSLMQPYFADLVQKAIENIQIPKEISSNEDGDGVSPRFHALNHGPCAKLDLTFDDPIIGRLKIDIAIAPAIRVPWQPLIPKVLEETFHTDVNRLFLGQIEEMIKTTGILLVPFSLDDIEPSGDKSWKYIYSETWRVSFSKVESKIFSMFSTRSTEKRLVRILKMLVKDNFRHSEALMEEANVLHLKEEEPPSTFVSIVSIDCLTTGERIVGEECHPSEDTARKDSNEEILYNREEENRPRPSTHISMASYSKRKSSPAKSTKTTDDPDLSLLQTYVIKMVFFYLKLSDVSGSEWREEELADILLQVLDTLYDAYLHNKRGFLHFWFRGHVGKTPKESARQEILLCLEKVLKSFQEL